MVVWVGRDDNQPTGLTGASGAAKLWARTMSQMPLTRLDLSYGDKITTQKVIYSENPLEKDCRLSRNLPIITDSLPLENLQCDQRIEYQQNHDEQKYFEPSPKKSKKSLWRRIFGKRKK